MHPTFEPHRARAVIAAAVAAAATLMALPASSFAQDDPAYRQYRFTVLGDSQARPPAPPIAADRIEVQTIPGSYARQLMYLGQDAGSAIAAARAVGEVPLRRTLRVVTRQPSPQEAYQRHLGNRTTPATSYQVLAEAPVEPEVVQAGMAAAAR